MTRTIDPLAIDTSDVSTIDSQLDVLESSIALVTQAPSTPTVSILAALDTALSTVRDTNPDIPTALAVVIATGRGKVHGSFTPGSWEDTSGSHAGSARHEILMSSESLARGAELTLTTLIHESVHAACHVRGVKDTSRQGRFHNRKFEELASAYGLLVVEDSKSGHATTGLNEWAKVHYTDTLALLESVLTTHRKPAAEQPTKPKTSIKVTCDCEQAITVPIKWWDEYAADNLRCQLCIDSGESGEFREFA